MTHTRASRHTVGAVLARSQELYRLTVKELAARAEELGLDRVHAELARRFAASHDIAPLPDKEPK